MAIRSFPSFREQFQQSSEGGIRLQEVKERVGSDEMETMNDGDTGSSK